MQETIEKTTAMVEHLEAVNEILKRNGSDPSRLITILQEVQEVYKYLSKDIISYVATSLDVPVAQVYGVATFYAHFSLNPKGKHILRLCDGTACHVKKSHALLECINNKLNLSDEKRTTDDALFTLEQVSCLGACGLAPVIVVDEVVHGQATPAQVEQIIDGIIAVESGKGSDEAAKKEGNETAKGTDK